MLLAGHWLVPTGRVGGQGDAAAAPFYTLISLKLYLEPVFVR